MPVHGLLGVRPSLCFANKLTVQTIAEIRRNCHAGSDSGTWTTVAVVELAIMSLGGMFGNALWQSLV